MKLTKKEFRLIRDELWSNFYFILKDRFIGENTYYQVRSKFLESSLYSICRQIWNPILRNIRNQAKENIKK